MTDQDRARALLDELNNIRSLIAGGYDCGDKRSPLAIIAAAFAEVREECAVKLEAMAHENEIGQYILREAAAAIRANQGGT